MGEKGSGNPLEVSGEGSQAARGFWTGWVPESMGQGAVEGLRVPRPCFLCAFEVLWPNPEWGDQGNKDPHGSHPVVLGVLAFSGGPLA